MCLLLHCIRVCFRLYEVPLALEVVPPDAAANLKVDLERARDEVDLQLGQECGARAPAVPTSNRQYTMSRELRTQQRERGKE